MAGGGARCSASLWRARAAVSRPRRRRARKPPRRRVRSACSCSATASPPATACRPGRASCRGWKRRCGRAGGDVRVLDAGVSGDTTAGGLARLDWALAERPQAVLVELGGNDGLRGLPPRQSRANLAAILDKLAAREMPALLAGMVAPPNLGTEYGREFLAHLRRPRARTAGGRLLSLLPRRRRRRAVAEPAGRHPSQRPRRGGGGAPHPSRGRNPAGARSIRAGRLRSSAP